MIPICSCSCIWMLFNVALLWYIRCLCFLALTSSFARIRALPTSCGLFLAICWSILRLLSSCSFNDRIWRSNSRSSRRIVAFHFCSCWQLDRGTRMSYLFLRSWTVKDASYCLHGVKAPATWAVGVAVIDWSSWTSDRPSSSRSESKSSAQSGNAKDLQNYWIAREGTLRATGGSDGARWAAGRPNATNEWSHWPAHSFDEFRSGWLLWQPLLSVCFWAGISVPSHLISIYAYHDGIIYSLPLSTASIYNSLTTAWEIGVTPSHKQGLKWSSVTLQVSVRTHLLGACLLVYWKAVLSGRLLTIMTRSDGERGSVGTNYNEELS